MIPTTFKRAISAIVGIPGQLEPYLEGLRQLPRVATLAQRDVVRFERDWTATSQRLDAEHKLASWRIERETLRGEIDTLKAELSLEQQQLAAEREAHERALNRIDHATRQATEALLERDEARQQLASALDKLDKLTRWRKQSEESCPKSLTEVEWSEDGRSSMGRCAEDDLGQFDYWRSTPESIQALEESEGGNGK